MLIVVERGNLVGFPVNGKVAREGNRWSCKYGRSEQANAARKARRYRLKHHRTRKCADVRLVINREKVRGTGIMGERK